MACPLSPPPRDPMWAPLSEPSCCGRPSGRLCGCRPAVAGLPRLLIQEAATDLRISTLFRAWRAVARGAARVSKPKPEQPKVGHCCGNSPDGAKRCFGHNYSHVARCGMCKPGRRQGPGGAKALKKVGGSRNAAAFMDWRQVCSEARAAKGAVCWTELISLPGSPIVRRRLQSTLLERWPDVVGQKVTVAALLCWEDEHWPELSRASPAVDSRDVESTEDSDWEDHWFIA